MTVNPSLLESLELFLILILSFLYWRSRMRERHLQRELRHRSLELKTNRYEYEQRLTRAEHDLKIAEIAVKKQEKAKIDFLGRIDRELKRPLDAILICNQLLKQENCSLENTDLIQKNSEYLLNLIDDIITLVELETDRLTVEEREFNLYKFLELVEIGMRARAEEKRTLLIFYIPEDVPMTIGADDRKLRQILLNLLKYSLAISEKGSVTLRVGVGDREWIEDGETIGECGLLFEIENRLHANNNYREIARELEIAGLKPSATIEMDIARHLIKIIGGNFIIEKTSEEIILIKINIPIKKIDIDNSVEENELQSKLEDGINADIEYLSELKNSQKNNYKSSLPVKSKSLQIMSEAWLKEFNEFARAGDSQNLYRMLDNISDNNNNIYHALKKMIDRYRFRELKDLTQEALDEIC